MIHIYLYHDDILHSDLVLSAKASSFILFAKIAKTKKTKIIANNDPIF